MTEFRYSRKATLGCLIGSIVLLALSVFAFEHPVGKVTVPTWLPALFVVATGNFAWLMIRPRRLVLDREGFTITGGLGWRPTRFRWQDVGEFYVYRLSKGTEAIGFKLKQPPRDHARFADSPSQLPAARSLPQGWDQTPASMVQELNSYRAQAIGGPAGVNKLS
jgi:hypothetical protein